MYMGSGNEVKYKLLMGITMSSRVAYCVSSTLGFRPVFLLSSNVRIKGGDGTSADTAYELGM